MRVIYTTLVTKMNHKKVSEVFHLEVQVNDQGKQFQDLNNTKPNLTFTGQSWDSGINDFWNRWFRIRNIFHHLIWIEGSRIFNISQITIILLEKDILKLLINIRIYAFFFVFGR